MKKAPLSDVTDEELDRVAGEAPALLAERDRREERRRAAAKAEAEEVAEVARRVEVRELETRHAAKGPERAANHDDVGAAILALRKAVEKYQASRHEIADLEARFETLGATPKPVRVPPFSDEVLEAARFVAPILARDLEAFAVDPLRMIWRTVPQVFKS